MRGSGQLRLALVLLVLSAISLTALDFRQRPTGPLGALRRGVGTLLGPVQRTVGGAAGGFGRNVGDLPRLSSSSAKERRLQAENDGLRRQLKQTQFLRCQAAQWSALLRLQQAGSYVLLPAHVISLGAAFGFEQTATVDAGSRDGVRVDMTVVTGLGLVGRVKQVLPYTSTLLLLTDPVVVVGSRLGSSSALGSVHGSGTGPPTFQLQGERPSLRRGDTVFTSGSATYPAGIPIGTLSAVRASPDALTRTADVLPFVDMGSLDLVAVLTNAARVAPRTPLAPGRAAAATAAACAPSPAAPAHRAPVPVKPAGSPT